MQLTFLDWAVIAAYFLFNIGIGLYYKSRAGTSISEYFLSGRNVPPSPAWSPRTALLATGSGGVLSPAE
jgi:SSS family solute:Na+ symporter